MLWVESCQNFDPFVHNKYHILLVQHDSSLAHLEPMALRSKTNLEDDLLPYTLYSNPITRNSISARVVDGENPWPAD